MPSVSFLQVTSISRGLPVNCQPLRSWFVSLLSRQEKGYLLDLLQEDTISHELDLGVTGHIPFVSDLVRNHPEHSGATSLSSCSISIAELRLDCWNPLRRCAGFLLCGQVHLFGHSMGHANSCHSPRLSDADDSTAAVNAASRQT